MSLSGEWCVALNVLIKRQSDPDDGGALSKSQQTGHIQKKVLQVDTKYQSIQSILVYQKYIKV